MTTARGGVDDEGIDKMQHTELTTANRNLQQYAENNALT